jgi:hypothetical protein
MGATAYGLGAAERGLRGSAGEMGRAAVGAAIQQPRELIQDQVKTLLKDKDEKNKRTPDELKTLRAARVPNASSRTLQRAQQILAGRTPQMRIETGFADLPSYGGPSGDTPTPPSPGESSRPVARQYGGPVEAGQPAQVGEEGREMFVPDAPMNAETLWKALLKGKMPVHAVHERNRRKRQRESFMRR